MEADHTLNIIIMVEDNLIYKEMIYIDVYYTTCDFGVERITKNFMNAHIHIHNSEFINL